MIFILRWTLCYFLCQCNFVKPKARQRNASQPASTGQRSSHRRSTYQKVLDARKQPIRGLSRDVACGPGGSRTSKLWVP